MARGEALSNSEILSRGDELLLRLAKMAEESSLYPKFCISTIMPKGVQSLTDIFRYMTPTIYYSLYSMDDEWRKKWMPAAMPVYDALDILADYQRATKKIIKIHFPFIKGENDSIENLDIMIQELRYREIAWEFNLVRYNPYSTEQGEESDERTVQRNLAWLRAMNRGHIKAIERVGFDVKASCGMFVQ
jgi:23S rRNA (adenine2503-C2)-methyltransferase